VHLHDLHEHQEVVVGAVVLLAVQEQLQHAQHQAHRVHCEEQAAQVVLGDGPALRNNHPLPDDAGVEGEDDVQHQHHRHDAVEVLVEQLAEELVLEALHEHGEGEVAHDVEQHEELPRHRHEGDRQEDGDALQPQLTLSHK
jgi:hypothetical protein